MAAASGASIAIPELLPDELVSAFVSSQLTESLLSLSTLGVRGCENASGGGDGVLGNKGHVEASSSGKKVVTEGDSVSDVGKSTLKSAGSVDIPKLFIAIDVRSTQHEM